MAKIIVKKLNKFYDNGFHAVKDVSFEAEAASSLRSAKR